MTLSTILLDGDDFTDLVEAGTRALGMLRLANKMYAQRILVMHIPDDTDPAQVKEFREQFEIGLASAIENLEEALIPFEEEDKDLSE